MPKYLVNSNSEEIIKIIRNVSIYQIRFGLTKKEHTKNVKK